MNTYGVTVMGKPRAVYYGCRECGEIRPSEQWQENRRALITNASLYAYTRDGIIHLVDFEDDHVTQMMCGQRYVEAGIEWME